LPAARLRPLSLRIINCLTLAAENFVPTYAALRAVHYHEQTAVPTRRNRQGAAQLPQSGRCYPRLPENEEVNRRGAPAPTIETSGQSIPFPNVFMSPLDFRRGANQMETTMPMTASIVGNDPLARFLRDHAADKHPIPLTATRIDVSIEGGLAIVTTERSFRNSEKQSIEATVTFPVPVDATLCALSARIDGRTLNAVAQARVQARETYEDAVDKGKAAVLHEELLKGIHMLSVAHVAPGAEIVVTDTWTAPLSFIGGEPQLRIPTTVGEIYGRSPLSADDGVVTGEHVHEATIAIACRNGTASLRRAGRPGADGRYAITLDAPIDIAVTGWIAFQLKGTAADGRAVTLDIEPAPADDGSLDIDLLFDRSGSMTERAVGDAEVRGTKFDVAKAGLAKVARERIRAGDRLRLWEFNDSARQVGEAAGPAWLQLVESIDSPAGGTEMGRAFDAVLATGKARNVVIVTDGKSYAFDPHRLARAGIRVTAVLIGDDALEAGIAHLAGMSGGQTFIAAGSDAGRAIGAAIEAARAPCVQPEPIEGTLSHVVALRRGARIVAAWGDASGEMATAAARLIGATAAMLAIPLMREDAAARLAESEGIVCHLTSLVLVDEAGAQQQGVPATRKVKLSAPPTALRAAAAPASALFALHDIGLPRAAREAYDSVASRACRAPVLDKATTGRRGRTPDEGEVSLRGIARRIDWDQDPDALRRGDLAGLPADAAAAIRAAAQLPNVAALAQTLGVDPIALVIALIARAAGKSSRSAQRIARAVLGKAAPALIEPVLREVGL